MAGSTMIQRFVRDESGVTMGITIIMVVLIGVMGAGLLTFVSRDLNAVVKVNQGQRALEAADAGVEAAKQQLVADLSAQIHYDGGADDLAWSYCYNVMLCSGVSPTATGSAGMRLDMENGDYAKVTILGLDQAVETYKVISEGHAGDARRKIEAIIRQDPKVSMPPAYFSRSDITLSGSFNPDGVSFFALKNVDFPSNVSLGTTADRVFGSWAATSGAGPYPNALGSFPNTYNRTARPSNLVGVGAQGQITGIHKLNALEGTRSFDSDSSPYRVVPNYNASPLLSTQKIAFPFNVPTPADDKDEINALRQRALALEQANPGQQHYIDSIPGNGQDDAGMPNRPSFDPPLTITTWPSGSTYETVMFYEFQTYHANNRVRYFAGASSCGTTTNKGAIVVTNGDMVFDANRRFDGAVIVRAYDSSGNLIPDSGGLFSGAGNPCINGYINTSGDQVVTGNLSTGNAPELSNLASFRGSMETVSWRELYE
jgi:Flp pilus assembly pilin Flp